MFPLIVKFAGYVAALQSSDAVVSIKTRRSCRLGSTQSPSKAHAQRRTIDRISDIERSRFNRAFGDCGATRGRIRIFLIRIGWRDIDHTIVGSWDRGPRSSSDRGRRSVFTKSDSPQFLLTFSIKRCSSSLCIFTRD